MKKQTIPNPGSTHPYPKAVKAGNWVFVTIASGVGPSFEEQFTDIFERTKTTLESLGTSIGNIVQLNVFFVNLERDFDKAGEIWVKYLSLENWPVGAWVGIKELVPSDPPHVVEMCCTAIIPGE